MEKCEAKLKMEKNNKLIKKLNLKILKKKKKKAGKEV